MPKVNLGKTDFTIVGIISKYQIINGISDELICKRLGITRRTLTNKRNNPDTFTLKEVREVLRYLRVPAEEKVEIL